MSLITPHNSVISWGTTTLDVTSISLSASSGGEVDMTSMSSKVRSDPQNTNRKLITRDYDTFSDDGQIPDVSVEFFAKTPGISLSDVGSKRDFSAQFYAPNVIIGTPVLSVPNVSAILTQVQLTGSAGEYVRGSATFKLSGL